MNKTLILIIATIIAAFSCGRTYNTTGMTRLELENLSDEVFLNGDYTDASRLYTELMFTYPGSPSMDFYLYRLGLSEAENHYWADALFYFDRVEREYARGQWSDDCSYQSARVWWEQRHDYRKDLTPVLNCRDELQHFFDSYPGSSLLSDAVELQAKVNDYLARRALFIGRFYARRQKYDASLLYLREALNDYGETECRGDVLVALGDVYASKGNEYTAREFYRRALDEGTFSEDGTLDIQMKLDEL